MDGVITGWNPAARRLYGYAFEDVAGRDVTVIIPPEWQKEHRSLFSRLQSEERIESFDTIRQARDGRSIDVSLGLSLIRSPSGEAVGIASITRDITAHKSAEEKFRLAVEACPSGMVMTDHENCIVLVNSETERLFGRSRTELIGKPVTLILPDGLEAGSDNDGALCGASGQDTGHSARGVRRDGSEFPVEINNNPIRVREGPLTLSVIVDITARRRAERLKDDFVSTVSHELRTPLTSISASLGLLSSGAAGVMSDAAARLLTIAHSNSQRLVRLLNDILDIEKMESGQIVFDLRPLEVAPLLEQVIEANLEFAAGHSVRLRLDAEGSTLVMADSDRLVQVLMNLISNAVKFSPADGEVTVRVAAAGGTVRMSVQDQGPGIPESFKPHVFEKFAQADGSDTRRRGGSGLGLSIVRQIVNRLNGAVGFEDAAGGGTIFHVDLPQHLRVIQEEPERLTA